MASVAPPVLRGDLPITTHAFDRARDRLGLMRGAFTSWVAATKAAWIPLDASFFIAHGLSVSREGWLYFCPWTPLQSLCLSVSTDTVLRTVIAYDDTLSNNARIITEQAAELAVLKKQCAKVKGRAEAAYRRIAELEAK